MWLVISYKLRQHEVLLCNSFLEFSFILLDSTQISKSLLIFLELFYLHGLILYWVLPWSASLFILRYFWWFILSDLLLFLSPHNLAVFDKLFLENAHVLVGVLNADSFSIDVFLFVLKQLLEKLLSMRPYILNISRLHFLLDFHPLFAVL